MRVTWWATRALFACGPAQEDAQLECADLMPESRTSPPALQPDHTLHTDQYMLVDQHAPDFRLRHLTAEVGCVTFTIDVESRALSEIQTDSCLDETMAVNSLLAPEPMAFGTAIGAIGVFSPQISADENQHYWGRDLTTGRLLWRFDVHVDGISRYAPCGDTILLLGEFSDSTTRELIASNGLALDASTGNIVWTFPEHANGMLVLGNELRVAFTTAETWTQSGTVVTEGFSVRCADGGDPIPFETSISTLVFPGSPDMFLGFDQGDQVSAEYNLIDAATGQRVSAAPMSAGIDLVRPEVGRIARSGMVVFERPAGLAESALDAGWTSFDIATGTRRWTTPWLNSPCIPFGGVLAATPDTLVTSSLPTILLDLRTGEPLAYTLSEDNTTPSSGRNLIVGDHLVQIEHTGIHETTVRWYDLRPVAP